MLEFQGRISTINIKSLNRMLCLFIFECTKTLSSLGIRDLYSCLRTRLSYIADKQNITSILHFLLHAILLILHPQPRAGSMCPLRLTCRAISFFLLPMTLQRQKPCYCWLWPAPRPPPCGRFMTNCCRKESASLL